VRDESTHVGFTYPLLSIHSQLILTLTAFIIVLCPSVRLSVCPHGSWSRHISRLTYYATRIFAIPSTTKFKATRNDTRPKSLVTRTRFFRSVETPVLFLVVCGSKYISLCHIFTATLQFAMSPFPTDDIFLHHGDIQDQVTMLSEIAPKCR